MKLSQSLTAHKSDINGITFSENVLVTCSSDKTVRVFALDTYNELPFSPLCDHTYAIHRVQVSPDGKQLVSCSTDGKCIIWDIKTGQKLTVFKHTSNCGIRNCAFAPNGKSLATGGDDDKVFLWDLDNQSLIRTIQGHEAAVSVLAYTPDSAYLVTGTPNGDMRVFDALYGHGKELFYDPEAHDLGITCAQVSPTYGSAGGVPWGVAQQLFLLATGGFDHLIKLWEIYSYTGSGVIQVQLRSKLQGHNEAVHSLCFSLDGRMLVSGSGDHSVRLWNPLRGELIYTLEEAHTRYISAVAISCDGKLIASGSNDRTVKVWNIPDNLDIGESSPAPTRAESTLTPAQGAHAHARKSVSSWSVQDVAAFIEAIGMGQYVANFIKNAIDGTELQNLSQESLRSELQIDALGHRSKILRAIIEAHSHPVTQRTSASADDPTPHEFFCPITREVMRDPVMAADGYSYERAAISAWVKSGKTNSPMTNVALSNYEFTPNRSLRVLIQRYQQA